MRSDKSETARHRLNDASSSLKAAADEFVAAHAAWAGGHAPVLWSTYLECDQAVVVCHRSWTDRMDELFESPEPVYRIELEDLNHE